VLFRADARGVPVIVGPVGGVRCPAPPGGRNDRGRTLAPLVVKPLGRIGGNSTDSLSYYL